MVQDQTKYRKGEKKEEEEIAFSELSKGDCRQPDMEFSDVLTFLQHKRFLFLNFVSFPVCVYLFFCVQV